MFGRQATPSELEAKTFKPSAKIQNGLLTPPKNDSPPPSYVASTAVESPPDITAAFANLQLDLSSPQAQIPTPDQCLAHLKLLEAFHSLREDVSQWDGLFGIHDHFASNSDAVVLTNIREKRWQVYVSRAAQRFEKWWKFCVMPNAVRQSQTSIVTTPKELWVGTTLKFEKQNLPPLGERCKNSRSSSYR